MPLPDNHAIFKMSPRARAAIEAAELHYRAEFAEALLSKNPLENTKDDEISAAAAFVKLAGKIDDKQRAQIVNRLMTADLLTRKITKREREYLKELVQPNSEIKMVERTSLPKQWAKIFAPDPDKDPKEPGVLGEWTYEVLRDFYPNVLSEDGRPLDAEPGTPTDEDRDQPPRDTPIGPEPIQYSRLRFVVDQIECINKTQEVGRDEIHYSGLATEGPLADFNQPSAIGAVRMGIRNAGSFSRGDAIDESVRGPMHVYNLMGQSLPRLFIIHMTMAEIDSGLTFPIFMRDFQQSLSAELTSYWAAALYIFGAGGFYGGALGSLGGPIGTVIGTAIGLAIGAILASVATPNRDDIFDYRSIILDIHANSIQEPPFNGNPISETLDLTIRETSFSPGSYRVAYHWELVGGSASQTSVDQD